MLFTLTLVALSSPLAAKSGPVAQAAGEMSSADVHSLVNRAVKTHPSVAAAEASVRAAGADTRSAKWQQFPSFSVEGLFLNQRSNKLQPQVIAEQPLWSGGRLSGTIKRAKIRENAALAAYDEAVLAIASSTSQAFYEVHRWRERNALLSVSLEQHNRMVATMERRVAQEVSPLSDLELARTRALQVEQQLFQGKAQERSALNVLRELVGDPLLDLIGSAPDVQTWPSLDDAYVIDESLNFSPNLKRLKFEAQALGAEAQITRASILPQLSSQYSYSDTFGHRVGIVLKAKTDGGLSRFAAADAARQRVEAGELQIVAGERRLREQLFALLREYESATSRLSGSVTASDAAQRITESYLRQFTSGRRTWLDVMNAVREETAAKTDAVEARIAGISSLARLLLLSGQWASDPTSDANS
ncbi:adhesin transport system outer membrane protein [Sphingorhabdus rigui]|uniref:Adhesin transport system outer membrane protein n=1 Tax=Sphingorhabdus rigui TaxID=1282858 RepID=A0A840B248_9SPHN|nr:TolC family protein [Sphingorhabdus rigui]MBB3943276.1 adhesin transport system outer membrane protein [Sphingorhabdus rigui]